MPSNNVEPWMKFRVEDNVAIFNDYQLIYGERWAKQRHSDTPSTLFVVLNHQLRSVDFAKSLQNKPLKLLPGIQVTADARGQSIRQRFAGTYNYP